jgi:hypothetical protein
MKNRKFAIPLLTAILVLSLGAVTAVADTIRLKDGTVIRGQIIGFRDQQFTVLIGSGSRGRRSRITLYMEDVDSIEFEGAAGATTAGAADTSTDDTAPVEPSRQPATRPAPVDTRPSLETGGTAAPTSAPRPTTSQPATQASPSFFQINVRVRADNTANGWTNTGLVVRSGQRLRIRSSGRVSLGGGRFSTPTGLPRVADDSKLMRNEPTGALIAVIGDDNDDFIFIGSSQEFVAKRDGVLFLGVNEGNLNDNTGVYETVIEAEAVSGRASR